MSARQPTALRRAHSSGTMGSLDSVDAGCRGSCAGQGRALVLSGVLAALAVSLQGCVLDIPRHEVGNWQRQESYLKKYAYVLPGANTNKSVLNSCMQEGLAPAMHCSGHGQCKRWFGMPPIGAEAPSGVALTFCMCDRDWAGPECDIQRRSQRTAFLLSIFLGFVGADQFYLGMVGYGVAKLFTLGGLGFWWLYDVVRIGSTAVATADSYRVANDVTHWAFVLILLVFTGVVGFSVSVWSIGRHRTKRAQEITLLRAEAPSGYSHYGSTPTPQGSYFQGPSTRLPPGHQQQQSQQQLGMQPATAAGYP